MTRSSLRNMQYCKGVAKPSIVRPSIDPSWPSLSHIAFFLQEVTTTFHELDGQKDALENDPEKLEVLFKEMIQMSLW